MIQERFGLPVRLIEGHNGVFDVTLKGNRIWSNQGKCTSVPHEEELFWEIRKWREPLPGKEKGMRPVLPLSRG